MVFLLLTMRWSFVSIDIQVREMQKRSRGYWDRFLMTGIDAVIQDFRQENLGREACELQRCPGFQSVLRKERTRRYVSGSKERWGDRRFSDR